MPGQDVKNIKITPEQKLVLGSDAAIRRVIACAGSGKTFVLTQNIVNILQEGLCGPEEILAITFTRNAAENMRSRIKESLNKIIDFSAINIYTFNSFGNLIISENSFLLGLGKDYRLINISKSWQLIYEIVKKSNLGSILIGKDTGKFTEDVLHYIHNLKSSLISPSELKKYSFEREKILSTFSSSALLKEELEILKYQPDLCSIYENYENIKHENNLVDYYDHIFLPYLLLKDNEEIKEKYRSRFRYMFIDEFQDTDIAQGYFISMLYKPDFNSIMIVGDDDQGIYSFRGACIENILDFHNWDAFSGHIVKDHFLTTNFRSGQSIIEALNNLISFNENRFEKDLKPEYENKKSEVLFSVFDFCADEADQIANDIIKLKAAGLKLKDIAILTRKKRFKYIVEALEKYGIKHEIISSRGFYYEPEVLYIISWLMVISDITDELHLVYLLQSQKYRISDRDIFFMKNFDAENLELYDGTGNFQVSLFDGITGFENNPYLKKETKSRLKEFVEEMNHYIFQSFSMKLNELVSIIYEYSGLSSELKSGFNKTGKRKIKNIELLIKISSDFESESIENNLEGFIVYLKDVARSEEEDPESIQFKQSDSVKVMSIHASKGLEFEAVFLPMLWKNDYAGRQDTEKFKIPASLRKDRKIYSQKHSFKSKEKFEAEIKKLNLEEERRIFYVACSRAKKLLFLSFSEHESEFKNWQERNLKSLQEKKLKISQQDKKSKIALPFLTDILIKNGSGDKVRILNKKAGDFVKEILPDNYKTDFGDSSKTNFGSSGRKAFSGISKEDKDVINKKGSGDVYMDDFLQIISDNAAEHDAAGNFNAGVNGSGKLKISGNIFREASGENIEKMLARDVNALRHAAYNSSGSNMNYNNMVNALKHKSKTLSQTDNASVKKNFSMTELLVYLDCPCRYKWKYIYNIPEPSGDALLTGEKVHKLIQLLTLQIFGEAVDKNFLGQTNKVQIQYSGDKKVEEFLNIYKKSRFYNDPDVRKITLEQLFYWKLGSFLISCKVDRLDYMADGSIRIIDYKTSGFKGRKPAASYLNQLKSYTGGISSLFSIPPKLIKAFLFYLKDGKIYERNFDVSEIALFEHSILTACGNINNWIFPKRPKGLCSKNCYYFSMCARN
jgi:DNA helicase II / ATP-dependent DNA helicase PcrA